MILEKINKPNDIKKLKKEELTLLAEEIRAFLIDNISRTGGHLASNLGTVELTIALHMICNFPEDILVWDVGHQSYTHKILTGRKDEFSNLRKYEGLSGFPKRSESSCDSFDTGHSSTSISAAVGYAAARNLKGGHNKVIAVIGDGALTGGMAYEALNNAAEMKKKNLLIVLNDNEMSISKNVGGVSANLTKMRTSAGYIGLKDGVMASLEKLPNGQDLIKRIQRTKSGIKSLMIPGMIFEDMGIMYLGPVDGHNIDAMIDQFKYALDFEGPVLVHCVTKKGQGFEPAERHPSRFHGTDPFDVETGIPLKSKNPGYTDVFSTVMRKMGDREPNVVAITAAMADNTGLRRFANMFPDRFFDVGIAEEHAVTFAAAMALGGFVPVVAIYSSFLQRAYDQILMDVCMQKLHVVFAIDRAGLVGSDGETHQGVFDLSFLSSMPGMTIMAPKNKWELSDMMKFAVAFDGPIAIRYPRGEAYCGLEEYRAPIALGKCEEIYSGERVLLLALGSMVSIAEQISEMLKEDGINAAFANARFAQPLDREYILNASKKYDLIVTLEENVKSGGFGEHVGQLLLEYGFKGRLKIVSVPDEFIPQGSVNILYADLKMDVKSVYCEIKELLEKK